MRDRFSVRLENLDHLSRDDYRKPLRIIVAEPPADMTAERLEGLIPEHLGW
jgi:hypothetical protein